MTTFDDRERAFETKFARDEDMMFRVVARRNKLAGLWAAAKMGFSGEEAEVYAQAVIQADFEHMGDEDVIRKLVSDLSAAQVEIDDAAIRTVLDDKTVEARHQLMNTE